MIRDRGIKKWQGFFMPEHIGKLKEYDRNEKKKKKPELDEQELEEIGIMVMDSLNYTLPIKITTWQDCYFKFHEGIISKVDHLMKYMILDTNNGNEKILINDNRCGEDLVCSGYLSMIGTLLRKLCAYLSL
ncbi:YolD-like family protein [Bacillus sp. FJAT-49705]|uniref:YolD-like family protein n=1 Tax=Cytobacillus citreus TaxID=2833586 RepID=A0ABS5NTC4_9BACI|nr:YolD-like family protein [Cytobacillus citreus]MBS4190806.1 YolD-like family protein [Cytobacillus citreus]